MGKVQVQAGRHYIDNEDHIWQDAAAAPASTCFRLQSGRGMAKTTATFTPAGRCVEFPAVLLVEEIVITNTPRHGELEGARDRAQPIDNATLAAATAEAEKQRQETGRTMGDPVALTGERKKTHGDWAHQARTANDLKALMRDSVNWSELSPSHQEALDMIQTKVSRILAGNPYEPDHWDDIAGYAHLGKGGHTTE